MTLPNRRRLFLYVPLLAVVLFFFMHPYFRQQMFGPKIKGEPQWIWQQEFRASVVQAPPATFWNKALALIGLRGQGIRWIGAFPRQDPAMLPVLLSLADDASNKVRGEVAGALGAMPCDDKLIDVLLRLTKDRDANVCCCAVLSLSRHGKNAVATLPRVRELMSDPRPEMRLTAADAVGRMTGYDESAAAVLKELLQTSTVRHHRVHAIHMLASMGKDTDTVFALLVSLSRNDPDLRIQGTSVCSLGNFGPKALPELLGFLEHQDRNLRNCAVNGIQMIGPAAVAAIPQLLQLKRRETDAYSIQSIDHVLHTIDPKQFPAPSSLP